MWRKSLIFFFYNTGTNAFVWSICTIYYFVFVHVISYQKCSKVTCWFSRWYRPHIVLWNSNLNTVVSQQVKYPSLVTTIKECVHFITLACSLPVTSGCHTSHDDSFCSISATMHKMNQVYFLGLLKVQLTVDVISSTQWNDKSTIAVRHSTAWMRKAQVVFPVFENSWNK